MSLSVKFRGPLHGVLEVDWAITRSLIVLQSIFHCKTENWDSGWLSVTYRSLTFLVEKIYSCFPYPFCFLSLLVDDLSSLLFYVSSVWSTSIVYFKICIFSLGIFT